MRVRLVDVAARAGVSMKTVSNVVNGLQNVAPATRTRVLAAVDELGYRPHLSARNLARGRTGTIAVALPYLAGPYFAELVGEILDAARAASWTVLTEQTDGGRDRELRVLRGELSHQVDGAIVSPLAVTAADVRAATARPGALPVVLLGEHLGGPGAAPVADHVAIDNVAAAREVTAHLLATGRRRVAAVGDVRGAGRTGNHRLHGYRQALAAAGVPADPDLVRDAGPAGEDGARAAADLLDLPVPPDAIFCFTDLLALGALQTLRRRDVRVPEEVALAGFDDTPYGRIAAPPLTTVSPDKTFVAATAVRLLDERLSGLATPGPREVVAPHAFRPRESSVPAVPGR